MFSVLVPSGQKNQGSLEDAGLGVVLHIPLTSQMVQLLLMP